MHYQAEPYPETKLVRCTRGSIYDVIVDLRPRSQTFKQWIGLSFSRRKEHDLCSAGVRTRFFDSRR